MYLYCLPSADFNGIVGTLLLMRLNYEWRHTCAVYAHCLRINDHWKALKSGSFSTLGLEDTLIQLPLQRHLTPWWQITLALLHTLYTGNTHRPLKTNQMGCFDGNLTLSSLRTLLETCEPLLDSVHYLGGSGRIRLPVPFRNVGVNQADEPILFQSEVTDNKLC
jgi:hypothetical protein